MILLKKDGLNHLETLTYFSNLITAISFKYHK